MVKTSGQRADGRPPVHESCCPSARLPVRPALTAPASRRAAELRARDRAFADQRGIGPVQSTRVDGGTLPSTPPSSTSSSPARDLGLEHFGDALGARRRRLAGTVGGGGRERTSSAATRRAIPACDVCRTAMPPSLPAERVGQSAFAAPQHQRQRPGQKAAASARADGDEHQSPLLRHRRPRDQQQERLVRRPALELGERGERRHRRAPSPGRRRSRWDRPAGRRAPGARHRSGIAASISRVGPEREDHRADSGERLGQRRDRPRW